MTFTLAFILAIITFYVNHRLLKMSSIKIIINSLFDIYGNENSFNEFHSEEVAKRLMDEIILIEKLNDNNFYINLELDKVKKLRLVYFNYTNKIDGLCQIKEIGFRRLGRSFIILSYFDIRFPYYK